MNKIVIIGAGPAGLTAAYELLSKQSNGQMEVLVVEKSGCVGGISRTINYNGNRMDIGGHRFFSKDARVMQWWDNIMPKQGRPAKDDLMLGRKIKIDDSNKNGPDPEKEDRVMLIRHRVSRIYYNNHFFDYPITMKPQTFINMGFLTTMKAGFSYLKSTVKKLPETSLENFYINRFGRVLYSMFFEGYTEKLWGRHPKDISADWGAQRVKGLSVKAVLKDMFKKLTPKKNSINQKTETSLIEEFYYPKYGPGHLWEQVAAEIEKMGGAILKNHSVKKIVKHNGVIKEVVCDNNGKEKNIKGDCFISSMPIKDLISDMNDVPENIRDISQGLPYRDFVTIGLLADKLNIENTTKLKTLNNIVPDCWIYVQDTGVKLGRIQIFNNWSPYLLKDFPNKVWLGLEYFCNEGDEFWNMSEDDAIEFAKKELIQIGVISKTTKILDQTRQKVKKAYPAYFDTYNQIDKVVKFINNIDNLYCVGRNGQHRYNNMDHSMATSFETADNILNGVKSKDNIWQVNTEQEYHEEQK